MAEKNRVISFEEVFLNSNSIFVEYVDLIKPTYYPLLQFMTAHEEGDHPIFDLSKIHGLSAEDLGDWYVSRKHQNPLIDLLKDGIESQYPSKYFDEMLNKQIEEVPFLINSATLFNMGKALLKLFAKDNYLVKKFFIWYPYENESVKKDIMDTFDPIMKYGEILTGDIVEALKKVPDDSTYAFSDITNVNALEYVGKLQYSSIIIPQEYGYNAEDGEFIIDFDLLRKEAVFKLDQFYATE